MRAGDEAERPADVAIVGGGAAGVVTAIRLLDDAETPVRVVLIEPRPALAQGVAYSTAYAEHLLNVSAGQMSALGEDPDHFVRFLIASGTVEPGDTAAIGSRFVTRAAFGRYLRETLHAQPRAGDLVWLQDEAVDIMSADPYDIELRSGRRVRARTVILALGNVARCLPVPPFTIEARPRIISAWNYSAVREVDPVHDVCILGAGLSMVDAVMSLNEHGHRGRITVLSRHGLMPLAHAAARTRTSYQTCTTDGSAHEVVVASRSADANQLGELGNTVRSRLHALRRRAAAAAASGQPWQWVMEDLRPHGQRLWRSLDATEQRRFLRHVAHFWNVHRHRMPPSMAERLERVRASGQLDMRAGRLSSLDDTGTRLRVRFRPKGRSEAVDLEVDTIINATGIETRLDRMSSALIDAVRARGLVSAGPHGIGLATSDHGEIVAADGRVMRGLLTLGGSRIGELWESIAIPELRVQAKDIAEYARRRAFAAATDV